jgi:hypothetical protein
MPAMADAITGLHCVGRELKEVKMGGITFAYTYPAFDCLRFVREASLHPDAASHRSRRTKEEPLTKRMESLAVNSKLDNGTERGAVVCKLPSEKGMLWWPGCINAHSKCASSKANTASYLKLKRTPNRKLGSHHA